MMWNNYNQQGYPFFNYPYNSNYNYNNSVAPMQQPAQMNNTTYSTPQTQGRPQDNIIWVSGKENARAMQLEPNSRVVLLDRDSNKFYIKITDELGLGKIRVFNYMEQNDNEDNTMNNNNSGNAAAGDAVESPYVTKAELEQIIKSLKGEINKENDQFIQRTDSKQQLQRSKSTSTKK